MTLTLDDLDFDSEKTTVFCNWLCIHSKIFLLKIVLQVTNHSGSQDTWSTIELT